MKIKIKLTFTGLNKSHNTFITLKLFCEKDDNTICSQDSKFAIFQGGTFTPFLMF